MRLTDIQQTFSNRAFDIEEIIPWLIGVGVGVALLSLIIAFLAWRNRRVRYHPHGSITDTRTITKIIRTAFDQRRAFEIQIQTENNSKRPTLRCFPEYLGKSNMTLEINGLKSLSDKWLNRNISVFFRIPMGGEFIYYTFSTSISSIHTPRQGICHIVIPIPTILDNRQKRSFLRMAPPIEFFSGAAMWYGASLPAADVLHTLDKWARPQLLFLPERLEQFHIEDLSAGGMRLSVPQKVAHEQKLHFASLERLMVMLDLFDPEVSKRLRFWVECRIQSVWVDSTTHDVHMGLQFVSWARPKEVAEFGDESGGLEWLRLSKSNEIEVIGNWIMRRHLEMFRDLATEEAEDSTDSTEEPLKTEP